MKISTSEMIKFYKEFDAVDFKYQLFLYDVETNEKRDNYIEKYLLYQKHEYAYQFSELTKREYGSVRANLDLVYAKQEMTDTVIEIYDLITQKIINQYINIDGIERMFSEKYADFEWDMHMGIDFSKHAMSFYRDHFIHQIRNAYVMHKLLEDGFEECVAEVFNDETNSKISRFVCKQLLQQMERKGIVISDKADEDIRQHYLRNIIYMSCYMSALFHDIGYPETTNIVNRRRITDYISNIYNFENGYSDFNRISTLLQNSLLFRVVSIEEIRKKIESSKPDHGALSAIIFLMHFYENGAIHRLEPYKLCTVELAGLAIYNHTAKYGYCDKDLEKEKMSHYRISFVLNPISYLLRIVDDMQEWDRIYFEISNNSNLIVCQSCKTPILRVTKGDTFYYRCNCNSMKGSKNEEKNGVFSTVFRYDAFPYRRVYNVTVCDELTWDNKKEDNKIIFKLHYDLENLLHIAYINPNYARYRIKELNQIKRLFDLQAVIPNLYIEYFVTANPILIKVKIIEVWLERKHTIILDNWWEIFTQTVNGQKSIDDLSRYLNAEWKNFKGLFELHVFCKNIADWRYKKKLWNYMSNALKVYIFLCFIMSMYKRVNSDELEDTQKAEKILDELLKKYEVKNKNLSYSEETKCLIHDCFVQMKRLYKTVNHFNGGPDDYYKQFEEDKKYPNSLYESCSSFIRVEKYEPINVKAGSMELDAFTDLALFQSLLKTIYTKDSRIEELKESLGEIAYCFIQLFYERKQEHIYKLTKLVKLITVLAFKYARNAKKLFEEDIYKCSKDIVMIKDVLFLFITDSVQNNGESNLSKITCSYDKIIKKFEICSNPTSVTGELQKEIENIFKNFGDYSDEDLTKELKPIVDKVVENSSNRINLEKILKIDKEMFSESNKVIDYIWHKQINHSAE